MQTEKLIRVIDTPTKLKELVTPLVEESKKLQEQLQQINGKVENLILGYLSSQNIEDTQVIRVDFDKLVFSVFEISQEEQAEPSSEEDPKVKKIGKKK